MLWWKEWRETRFGFLTALFFITGLVWTLPPTITLLDEYWLGIFLMAYTIGMAVILGSGAVAAEIDADTMQFIMSKPARRWSIIGTKYAVRLTETAAAFIVPVLIQINRDNVEMWMWVPPYLFLKYIACATLSVVFAFSITFLFSVIFRKQALCALAGISALLAYLGGRAMDVLKQVYESQPIDLELYVLTTLCAAAFLASLILFKNKEV
ncbi:MAG: hypothetical protein C4532_16780 [Candidatus Abyssobacteria bacterium SURF_17]|uniref:Uncharacterized protein n=1 Tax=Candidatus Abyssobacteria bacterium SURF_17 TaxID=2093361 RepID=A0A419ERB5_9BACT|nr:MAG: hypothetical protein C4532_16780 [Candidatus Abyssubacteria bacterium SURF_17]